MMTYATVKDHDQSSELGTFFHHFPFAISATELRPLHPYDPSTLASPALNCPVLSYRTYE